MQLKKDIQYNSHEECKLDLYIPDQFKVAVVLIHGGGLVEGSKDDGCYVSLANSLAKIGYFVAEINYRLLPKAKHPDYIFDSCDAVKYVQEYLKKNNFNVPIFVGGHSAGAYISIMIALNPKFLSSVDMDPTMIKGWLIDSAQMTTHFHVLSSRGLSEKLTRVDEDAPLFYVDENMMFNNMLLLTYENDMPCRREQNYLFYKSVMWNKGDSTNIEISTLPGGHCAGLGTFDKEGKLILVDIFDKFIKRVK